jgi:hypothetical protein
MKNLLVLSIFVAVNLLATNAFSAPQCGGVEINSVKPLGVATLNKLLWHVYDGEFWSDAKGWKMDSPHALHLKYFADIESEDFVERSLEELQRNPKVDEKMLARFKSELPPLMPSVVEGDSITAAYSPKTGLVFCHNGKQTGVISDAKMAEAFLGIWLGANTTEPEMRKKLLNL